MFIKFFEAFLKILNAFFFKVIYFKRTNLNFLKSYFYGKISIDKGFINIKNGLRTKGALYLTANGGVINIGERLFCNRNVSINCRRSITIGNDCIFGENICFYDHDHGFNEGALFRKQNYLLGDIVIGDNVWIGSNVTVLRGTEIGDNCVIAAGSIVKGSIEKDSLLLQKRESNIFNLPSDKTK